MTESTEKDLCSSEHYYFFPTQIWSKILSYLPVKSLLRFRSVCTTWKSIIEHPDFTLLHLKRYPNNILKSQHILLEKFRYLLTPVERLRVHRWSIRNRYNMEDITFLESPMPEDYDNGPYAWIIAGSVNGLLLLWRRDYNNIHDVNELILCNPSIKKHLYIPISDTQKSHMRNHEYDPEYYLGFGGGDHKIMVIMFSWSSPLRPLFSVEIFSLNTRSWHKLEAAETRGGFRYLTNRYCDQVTLGGSIYWIRKSINTYVRFELVNFDVSSESLSYTKLPEDAVNHVPDRIIIQVIVVRGSYIGILVLPHRESIDDPHPSIWILTEPSSSIGTNNSAVWTKWCDINLNPNQTYPSTIFCSHLLFGETETAESTERRVELFDPVTQESKIIASSDNTFPMHIDTYIESLLLL